MTYDDWLSRAPDVLDDDDRCEACDVACERHHGGLCADCAGIDVESGDEYGDAERGVIDDD